MLLIDVINDFEYPDGEELLGNALPVARCIAGIKRRARAANIATIYVNDNFGRWRSDFAHLLTHCLAEGTRGRVFVEQVAPDEKDYFILKPKHSGFFQTPLEILLKYLGVRSLILTGLTSNNCVLFTANDAYMRDLKLYVPRDCVAAANAGEHDYALGQIESVLKADTSPSTALDLQAVVKTARS